MTATLAHRPRSEPPLEVDQRVVVHGMSWQAYEAILAWRGESKQLRRAMRAAVRPPRRRST